MKSASEKFVLGIIRACMPRTGSGIRFDYGTDYGRYIEEHGGLGARTGVMSIIIHQVGPQIRVEYSLQGAGDGVTWNSGRCTIRICNERDCTWEFFCERQDNGLLRVRTMAVMRQCRVLKKAVYFAIRNLGDNAEIIARRLQQMGYTPDIEGLKRFIGEVFALIDVEIVNIARRGASLPEIQGRRADSSDLELKLYNPSGAIGAFIAQQLSLSC